MGVRCPSCGHKFDILKDIEGFQAFWDTYPRKEGKGLARRAYTTALTKTTKERILIGAQHYAGQRLGKEKQYTLLPATWLNGEHWDDEGVPVTDAAGIPPSVPLHSSWAFDKHQMMIGLIGAAKFSSWFGGSRIERGDYTIIIVPKEFHRRWIERNFSQQLNQVFGLFEVRVES